MKIQTFLEESPAIRILSTATELERSINRNLAAYSINLSQSLILVSIFSEQGTPVRPRQLHRVFGTTKGNISQCISRLEELGLIKRKTAPADRRSCVLQLTENGRKLSAKLIGYFDRLQTLTETALRPRSTGEVLASLEAIRTAHR